MTELSKTAQDKIKKSLMDKSSFGGESDFSFDGLRLNKITAKDVAKATKEKADAVNKAQSESEKSSAKEGDGENT